MGAVPHDVRVGNDATSGHEEAGAGGGGLSARAPWFGVVWVDSLDDELLLCYKYLL